MYDSDAVIAPVNLSIFNHTILPALAADDKAGRDITTIWKLGKVG